MEKGALTIATMTWARSEAEERLLREALAQLGRIDLPVIVTDGGSAQNFIDFLTRFPLLSVLTAEKTGLYNQIRASLRAALATEAPYVLYTEPDKKDFFASGLEELIIVARQHETAGVVLASRSTKGFDTFPEFQRFTETTINRLCAEMFGLHADFSYGPFICKREIVQEALFRLEVSEKDIGWGWRLFLFATAHRLGYEIFPLVGNFECPPDQREDSEAERLYRIRQLGQSIEGLLLSNTIFVTSKS